MLSVVGTGKSQYHTLSLSARPKTNIPSLSIPLFLSNCVTLSCAIEYMSMNVSLYQQFRDRQLADELQIW